MSYKLFLDDERYPVSPDCMIARTSYDAIYFVTHWGLPYEIMFDHDLRGDDTAMVFINFLADYLMDNDLKLPKNFTFSVHSQNPVGAENIRSHMNQIIEHFGE